MFCCIKNRYVINIVKLYSLKYTPYSLHIIYVYTHKIKMYAISHILLHIYMNEGLYNFEKSEY